MSRVDRVLVFRVPTGVDRVLGHSDPTGVDRVLGLRVECQG
jgi:hypothetical protein